MGKRKTRGVSNLCRKKELEGGLCVDSMRPPPVRIGYDLDALHRDSETRRIGDRQYPQDESVKKAWRRTPVIWGVGGWDTGGG